MVCGRCICDKYFFSICHYLWKVHPLCLYPKLVGCGQVWEADYGIKSISYVFVMGICILFWMSISSVFVIICIPSWWFVGDVFVISISSVFVIICIPSWWVVARCERQTAGLRVFRMYLWWVFVFHFEWVFLQYLSLFVSQVGGLWPGVRGRLRDYEKIRTGHLGSPEQVHIFLFLLFHEFSYLLFNTSFSLESAQATLKASYMSAYFYLFPFLLLIFFFALPILEARTSANAKNFLILYINI